MKSTATAARRGFQKRELQTRSQERSREKNSARSYPKKHVKSLTTMDPELILERRSGAQIEKQQP